MVFSVIQKSQLEGAKRLDAEYYQPEYLRADEVVSTIRYSTLGDIADKVFSGPFGSTLTSDSYQTQGTPFIRIGDISDIFIEPKDLVYISPEEHKRIFSTHLKPRDIVLSKIGTVGRLSVISEDLGEVNISENNIGIRLSKLSPERRAFLLFFLLSKYGQLQLLRRASGNVQPKLNVADVGEIKVPGVEDFALKKFSEFYERITKFRKKSESFYFQAERTLLEELDLAGEEFEDELTYVVSSNEVEEAERVDADYFQPKYEKLLSKLKTRNAKPLGSIVSMTKGTEPGSSAYCNKGKPFIRVSNLTKEGLDTNNQQYLSDDLYNDLKDKFEPQVGEVLLTKDATPGVAYVVKEPIGGIISGGILRLRVTKDIDPEYLALCLNSVVGKLQVTRSIVGSVISHWRPAQIEETLIPILPKPTQQKIADLVKKSHQARKEAKELFEEAKRKVEEMVEKGA